MIAAVTGWFASAKLWLIGAALAVALIGLAIWRAYAKGKTAEQADAAIAGLKKVIEANDAKVQAKKEIDNGSYDYDRDPDNRDTWK